MPRLHQHWNKKRSVRVAGSNVGPYFPDMSNKRIMEVIANNLGKVISAELKKQSNELNLLIRSRTRI